MSDLMLRSMFPDNVANKRLFQLMNDALIVGYQNRIAALPVLEEMAQFLPQSAVPPDDRVRTTSFGNLGDLTSIGEGEDYPTDRIYEGYDKTFTFTKQGVIIRVTDEMLADGRDGMAPRLAQRLGARFALWRIAQVAAIYKDAFAGSTYTGGDGKALCANDHTSPDGSITGDNLTTGALSADTLAAAEELLLLTPDDRNSPIGAMPTTLIVPPALKNTALQLLQSVYQTDSSSTAAGAINPLQGIAKPLVVPHLSASYGGSDTAWFLVDRDLLNIGAWEREAPTTIVYRDEDTDTWIYKLRCRYAFGFNDWRGVVGSPGT